MKPGMTFTIEPILVTADSPSCQILDDGWTGETDEGRGAQFVHTVAIHEHGCEVLTLPEGNANGA